MKKSNKKSTVKSKSKKVKNSLKKYQGGGGVNIAPLTTSATPTTGFGSGNLGSNGFGSAPLGGDSYLSTPSLAGSNTFNTLYGGSTPSFSSDNLTNVSDPSYGGFDSSLDTSLNAPRSLGDYYKDTQTAFGDKSNTANIMNAEYKAKPGGTSKPERDSAIASSVLEAIPGTGFIGEALKKKTIDDPNRYYNKDTKSKLESYNRKISAAKSASSVGKGIMAVGAGLTGTVIGAPLGALITAAGGIVTGVSEGFASGYGKNQSEFGAAYDEKVAKRQRDVLRTDEQRKKNAAMNAQQYYNVPTAKTGGLMKYMEGGYTKVTGPSHENGGVPMDLDEDGVIDSELEGNEIIEELPEEGLVAMKQGGSVPKKYIWSDHLKTGGMSFAKKFEKLRKGGARPGDVEKLRIEQELAAKRDPSKLYAKYGGMHKYQQGGTNTQYVGLDSTQVSNLQKYKASGMSTQDAIRRATLGDDDLTRRLKNPYANKISRPDIVKPETMMLDRSISSMRLESGDDNIKKSLQADQVKRMQDLNRTSFESNRKAPIVLPMKSAIDPDLKRMRDSVDFKNGGMMKYGYGGKMEYMKEGGKLPKEVLESRLESHMSEGEAQDYIDSYKGGGLWANIHAKRKRIAAGSGEKMRKPGSEGAPTAKALIESKRDGGLKKYQNAGLAGPVAGPTVPAGPLVVAAPTAKTQFLNAMLASNKPAGTNPKIPVSSRGQYSTAPVQNQANLNTAPQKRVSRTGAGKFLAEYGAPLANVVGEAANIGMDLRQTYTPIAPVTARDVKAEQVFIDRAKDKRVGARESELVAAKRAIQQKIGSGQGQLNAARMISLRAQEEAAQNVYDINRQASATEQQLNQRARLEADMANQSKDLVTSESGRNEGLRKESFENMRKKYIGSVAGQLGNELASGMYRKEYINATLPDGVNPYELKPGAYEEFVGKINPDTKKEYTPAEIWKAINLKLAEERKT